jgi:hypothetical protein
MQDLRYQLTDLLDQAFVVLFKDSLGLNHVEPIFLKILGVLCNNEKAKAWFLERARNTIVVGGEVITNPQERPSDFIDSDLICFVAHATRWDEFSQAVRVRRQSSTYAEKLPGSDDIADLVASALSDNWEDKDFYKTFET